MATQTKPTFRARIEAAYRSFVGIDAERKTGFDWINSDLPGNVYSSGRSGRVHWVPGTNINWDVITGDLWNCPAVQACLNWINRNFPQAPPIVEQMKGKEWQKVADHPLVTLLNRPNPLYDGSILFQGLILSLETNGNGYAIIERTGAGVPAELWWAPHDWITPWTAPGNDPRFVDYYDYWLGPKHFRIPPQDVLHLKYGMDPLDVRLGLAPLSSAARDVNALQQAGNYRPNILRNFGVVGRTITNQDPNVTIDPKTVKDYVDSNSQGDKAGSTLVFDFNAEIAYPKTTPQDMELTTLEDRPEADVCALIGIPIQVTGLHGGREAKTYANTKEAREAAWEEKLIPLGSMMANQIGHKLIPELMGVSRDPTATQKLMAVTRMAFDYSDIRPLQPDLDKLHARALLDWQANLITLGQWYKTTNQPEPTDLPDWETIKDQRFRDFSAPSPAQQDAAAANDMLNQDGKPKGLLLSELMPIDWAEHIREEIKARHVEEDTERLRVPVLNGNGVH